MKKDFWRWRDKKKSFSFFHFSKKSQLLK